MGPLNWLTRDISPLPIAVHFGSDVIRLMQITGSKDHQLHNAIEVSKGDTSAIKEALKSFKGNRCTVCLSSEDVLVQHIRIAVDADEHMVRTALVEHDPLWSDAEIRQISVTTTGRAGNTKQELLCVGIDRTIARQTVDNLEGVGAEVIALTVPLYAAVRAFHFLYRRDGDEKMTSMLIDMDSENQMVMISHGSNCVFANKLEPSIKTSGEKWEPPQQLVPISSHSQGADERRSENDPRGLYGIMGSDNASVDDVLVSELFRCLRHHDTVFPHCSVDRLIFTGVGANDAERCAAIASELNVQGFISDPSAWIAGAEDLAGGPAWTTVAGLCMRYAELAA